MLNKEGVAKVNFYGPEDVEIPRTSLVEWLAQARKQSAEKHLQSGGTSAANPADAIGLVTTRQLASAGAANPADAIGPRTTRQLASAVGEFKFNDDNVQF